jgi:hypothetical protein
LSFEFGDKSADLFALHALMNPGSSFVAIPYSFKNNIANNEEVEENVKEWFQS